MNFKNSIYRVTALILAFLMFFTSVGFSVDMHYCQGNLKSFSLLGKAKNCHEMAKGMANCPHHQKMAEKEPLNPGCSLDKKDCCQNKLQHFQSDEDQKMQSANFELNLQLQSFIVAFTVAFFVDTFIESDHPAFALYKSPLIPRDIPVLFESFLL